MSSPLATALRSATREFELEHAAAEERELELTQAESFARDPLGWLDSANVWIQSKFADGGRTKLRPLRMQLYPTQIETVEAWIRLDLLQKTGELRFRNIVIEKSRQIGETWLFAALVCWALHYHAVTGLAMHVDGAEIDDGGQSSTPKSLFGKVRFVDSRLDRGKVPGLGRLSFRPFSTRPAKIANADNGSVFYGEGQTDDPGRGGTFDCILIDEAAFVRHGEKVYAAIDEACPEGKALLSTVNGDGNFHARLADEKPEGWRYLRLHWSQHPVYSQGLHVAGELEDCGLCAGNREKLGWSPQAPQAHRYAGQLASPWYDERVVGKTDEQVANELDIDRGRALAGRVYSEFQSERHVVAEGIPYSEELGHMKLELAWDYGLDVTSVVFCQDSPFEYRVIGEVEMGDLLGTTATPERVAAEVRSYLVDVLGIDEMLSHPRWTRLIHGVGDPSGGDRSYVTGTSAVQAYAKQGFEIGRPPRQLCRTVSPSIASVKRLLLGTPKPLRVCGLKCPRFIEHMRNNRWPTDALGHRRITATTPEDDIHNHMMRAFSYLILSKFPPPTDEGVENLSSGLYERVGHRRNGRSSAFDAKPLAYGSTL